MCFIPILRRLGIDPQGYREMKGEMRRFDIENSAK